MLHKSEHDDTGFVKVDSEQPRSEEILWTCVHSTLIEIMGFKDVINVNIIGNTFVQRERYVVIYDKQERP